MSDDDETLAQYVREKGGAISLAEAAGWLCDHNITVTVKELALIHDDLSGPVVGRSRVVVPDIAVEIESELVDCDGANCDCPEHHGDTCEDENCACPAGHEDDDDEEGVWDEDDEGDEDED